MRQYLLEILQAVCLFFVHIPDIGQTHFQSIEQKLVQCCETHIEAQSCKASYAVERKQTLLKLSTKKPKPQTLWSEKLLQQFSQCQEFVCQEL